MTNWGCPGFDPNTVPANLPLVKAIAAGWFHNVALLQDGTVTNWGQSAAGSYALTAMPAGLTNVTALAVSALHSMALRAAAWMLTFSILAMKSRALPPRLHSPKQFQIFLLVLIRN